MVEFNRRMWDFLLATLYLFLPAYAANSAPVIAARFRILPSLSRPLDGGRVFAGGPLLGGHKSFRGVLMGLLAGILTALLQAALADANEFFRALTLFPYAEHGALLWGLLLGGGALAGDIGKSFVKRRFGIPPGARWFPWDQLDMVIGALLLGSLVFPFSFPMVMTLLVLTPLLGLLTNVVGYLLHLKEAW